MGALRAGRTLWFQVDQGAADAYVPGRGPLTWMKAWLNESTTRATAQAPRGGRAGRARGRVLPCARDRARVEPVLDLWSARET